MSKHRKTWTPTDKEKIVFILFKMELMKFLGGLVFH